MRSLFPSFRCYDVPSVQCYTVPVCGCEDLGAGTDEKEVANGQCYIGAAELSTSDDIADAAAMLFDALAHSGSVASTNLGISGRVTACGVISSTSELTLSTKPAAPKGEDLPRSQESFVEFCDADLAEGSKAVSVAASPPSVSSTVQVLNLSPDGSGSEQASVRRESLSAAAISNAHSGLSSAIPVESTPPKVKWTAPSATVSDVPAERGLARTRSRSGSQEEEIIVPADVHASPFFDRSPANPFYDRFQGFHEVGSLDDNITI
mmetsp:Transcript_95517/g.274000  ORF Transcript_95517/g.274000 Transcript_95517/m.274000 type:complete len:264 (-) Transcript_95517:77-868(-)